ncbi:hypothetical protein OKW22_001193 [Bacilli bacterium PM5-3]|nr:hypothetical protein [Bacilli bacterium PM5-3]MDH6604022.1 hypothetical protein [Bacilli bacterium PM5-9]
MNEMNNDKILKMSFTKIYDLYLQKAIKKNRTKEEVDLIICWLSGYSADELANILKKDVDVASFFNEAKNFNVNANLIKGVVCGVRVEDVTNPLVQKVRYLDKLIDELAKGKSMDKIIRK